MKIGIDASRLIEQGRTGTENYLYSMVKSLAKLDLKNQYILFFKNKISNDFWEELSNSNKNFSYKVLKSFISWTQLGLAKEILKSNLDILLCPWHTVPILALLSKTKIVSVIHDLTGKPIPTFLSIKGANKVIAVSGYTKKEIPMKFVKENVSVISEGYSKDLSKVSKIKIEQVREKYKITKDYIFFLGTIGPRKNLKRMIEAYKQIKDEYNVDFVLAGKIVKGYENLVKDVTHIGYVPDEDKSALYSGAEFLSFVSQEEGFGLPILEAMSCGTPVLTADATATAEIASNAALLVEPDSINSIKNGMIKLLKNKDLKNQLVERGYKNIKKYSWEKSAKELIEVFKKL